MRTRIPRALRTASEHHAEFDRGFRKDKGRKHNKNVHKQKFMKMLETDLDMTDKYWEEEVTQTKITKDRKIGVCGY